MINLRLNLIKLEKTADLDIVEYTDIEKSKYMLKLGYKSDHELIDGNAYKYQSGLGAIKGVMIPINILIHDSLITVYNLNKPDDLLYYESIKKLEEH